ncbi:MAG: LptF/LptG family permease [Bacteroidetes bacterium]|nr:LptF/LptG family permease [Bacteroidota bacterium]
MILSFYIARKFFIPFLFSVFSLFSVFILQFLMRFAEQLIGKGIDTLLILQLIAYNLAWMMVLVVPMSVLVATLMAFGGLSQNNEITAIRAAGLSLYRLTAIPFMMAASLVWFLIYFNNNILPDANHKTKNLMWEITATRPALSIVPNVFMTDIIGYAILAEKITQDSNKLLNVKIYDNSRSGFVNILTAKKADLNFNQDRSKLLMNLYDGEIHEQGDGHLYRKLKFKKHILLMNSEQFSLKKITDEYRSDRELGIDELRQRADSLARVFEEHVQIMKRVANPFFYGDSAGSALPAMNAGDTGKDTWKARLASRVKQQLATIETTLAAQDYLIMQQYAYLVEVEKKYSIPAACIVFLLLGVPLGMMTRRGGFGAAASISLFFFLLYWSFLIGGEKLADRGIVSPFLGMWAANVILAAMGVYLFFRSVRDNTTIDLTGLQRFIPKRFRKVSEDA